MATCVYCGGRPVTREHVFGAWLQALIPLGENRSFQKLDYVAVGPRLVLRNPRHRSLGRSVGSWQVRVVCGPCNNEWMSRIQNTAKEPLTALIRGQVFELTVPIQHAVAAWTAMTVMMAEYTHPDRIIAMPRADVQALHAFGTAGQPLRLDNWVIAIAHYLGSENQPVGRIYPYIDAPGDKFVGISSTLRLGELMVQAWLGVDGPPDIDVSYAVERGFRVIWPGRPATESLAWPPWLKLHDRTADQVATLMRARDMGEAIGD